MIASISRKTINSLKIFSVDSNKHIADEVVNSIMDDYKECLFSEKLKFQINLIIDELFGNISRYAFEKQCGRVNIVTWIEKDPLRFIVKFVDNGTPFNPLEAENPNTKTPLEERKIGGLGIYIIKNMVDTMEYKYIHGCNVLIVTKELY